MWCCPPGHPPGPWVLLQVVRPAAYLPGCFFIAMHAGMLVEGAVLQRVRCWGALLCCDAAAVRWFLVRCTQALHRTST